jgi:hypothetical protein
MCMPFRRVTGRRTGLLKSLPSRSLPGSGGARSEGSMSSYYGSVKRRRAESVSAEVTPKKLGFGAGKQPGTPGHVSR